MRRAQEKAKKLASAAAYKKDQEFWATRPRPPSLAGNSREEEVKKRERARRARKQEWKQKLDLTQMVQPHKYLSMPYPHLMVGLLSSRGSTGGGSFSFGGRKREEELGAVVV